jgi:hypothetical protein
MKALNLKSILTDYYLIIPEIQREYVWGAKANEDKLVRFIEDILKSVTKRERKNVGFLYSYATYANEHYIIDGQQRFTSLILLLYVSAKKEGKIENFRTLLNTEEPTLKFSYNVRPLTEQFFRLLITRNECGKCVKDNIWYTQAFDKDMTITSMINAVEKLYDVINESSEYIYDSLLEYIEFWYFDVQQTSQGEELYISMNSRGEKLTDSEQIKPLLMKQVNNSDQEKMWDDMEEFFFQMRADNAKLEDVDIAINNFIILVLELITGTETQKIQPSLDSQKIRLDDVINEYKGFLSLFNNGQISTKGLSELYKDPMPRNIKYMLESLLIGRLVVGDNIQELERIKRLVTHTLVYEPNTSFNQFYNYFLTPLKNCNSNKIYQYIANNRDKFVKEEQDEHGFLPIYEYEKVDAINNGIVSETDIVKAETFAFFDGRIHFLYHDMNGGLDWESFNIKLSSVQSFFDENGVKPNYRPILLRRLISLFDEWGMFLGMEYDCRKETWHKILVKKKWIKPIHILLTSDKNWDLTEYQSTLEDITYQHVQEEFVKTNLLDYINNSCLLHQYSDINEDNVYVLYPYNSKKESNKYIIANKRNEILKELLDKKLIYTTRNIKDSKFFWGWNIEFTYREKNFNWIWNNKIVGVNSTIKKNLNQKETCDSIVQKLDEMLKDLE